MVANEKLDVNCEWEKNQAAKSIVNYQYIGEKMKECVYWKKND